MRKSVIGALVLQFEIQTASASIMPVLCSDRLAYVPGTAAAHSKVTQHRGLRTGRSVDPLLGIIRLSVRKLLVRRIAVVHVPRWYESIHGQ